MPNLIKNNEIKGITLIALVITIIVLLILAGISISMISGNDGILSKGDQAISSTEEKEIYEQISLAVSSGEIKHYADNIDRLTSYKNTLLEDVVGIDENNLTDNGSNLITGTVTNRKGKVYDFSINVQNSSVTVVEHIDVLVNLAETITSLDYGKRINYSVTINGVKLDNWKIFLNNSNNVYILLDNYLEASLIPNCSGLAKNVNQYPYSVWSSGR